MFQFMGSKDYGANHLTFLHRCSSSSAIFLVIGVCSLSSRLCLIYLCIPLSALHLQSGVTQQGLCKHLWSGEGQCNIEKGHRLVHFEFKYIFCHLLGNWAISPPQPFSSVKQESSILLTSALLSGNSLKCVSEGFTAMSGICLIQNECVCVCIYPQPFCVLFA